MELKSININKSYKGIKVVKAVSVSLNKGEIVGLLGPNGAGKTTTFDMIVAIISPEEGEVFLNDLKITKVPMYKRSKMGIGYLPQEVSVFRKLSVEDNIKAILEMSKLLLAMSNQVKTIRTYNPRIYLNNTIYRFEELSARFVPIN